MKKLQKRHGDTENMLTIKMGFLFEHNNNIETVNSDHCD